MLRLTFCLVSVLALLSAPAWAVDANVLELEIMKKNAEKKAEWDTKGSVSKSEIPGFYRHFPGDWNAFWLKPDGTGLLYGGMRGNGVWAIMWDYFPNKGGTMTIRSVQLKREYKAIKKDGKVWFVEGREVWRQHVHFNHPIKQPRDKAKFISKNPPKGLQRIK
jgi:hypothetical protein